MKILHLRVYDTLEKARCAFEEDFRNSDHESLVTKRDMTISYFVNTRKGETIEHVYMYRSCKTYEQLMSFYGHSFQSIHFDYGSHFSEDITTRLLSRLRPAVVQ